MWNRACVLLLVLGQLSTADIAVCAAAGSGPSTSADARRCQLVGELAPSVQECVDSESGEDDVHVGHVDRSATIRLSLTERHGVSIRALNIGHSRVPADVRGRSPPA